jgi:hypothetical protein
VLEGDPLADESVVGITCFRGDFHIVLLVDDQIR